MKKISRVIDTNAHIENISCSVVADTSNSLDISISFDNLSDGVITAVKFNATGYNSFGDVIPVNGNQQFFLVIQDIKIDKNERAENLHARIENSDIRRIELEECQICYDDGSVVSYEGKAEITVKTEEFENSGSEGELLSALKNIVSQQIKYLPRDMNDGWVCSCGRYNKNSLNKCTLCGLDKTTVFKIGNSDFNEDVKKQNNQLQEAIADKEKKEESRRKKKSLLRGLLIIIAVIAVIALISLIVNSIKLSERRTYSSAEQMKTELQGTYTYYSEYTGKASSQIFISGDTATYAYSSLPSNDITIKEWDYKNGVIRTFQELVVTKSGDLKDGDKIYKKGGASLKNSYKESLESGYSVLKVTIDSVSSNTSYCICTGSVKNTGSKTYKYVTVKGSFKDADGNVIDTDSTYAVGSEGLAPGESSTFRLSVTKNSTIKSCSVSILDFD